MEQFDSDVRPRHDSSVIRIDMAATQSSVWYIRRTEHISERKSLLFIPFI